MMVSASVHRTVSACFADSIEGPSFFFLSFIIPLCGHICKLGVYYRNYSVI